MEAFRLTFELNASFNALSADDLTRLIAMDDGASYALKENIAKAATRDPVDALRDAEVALGIAYKRAHEVST
jgi:hypothetical protein